MKRFGLTLIWAGICDCTRVDDCIRFLSDSHILSAIAKVLVMTEFKPADCAPGSTLLLVTPMPTLNVE